MKKFLEIYKDDNKIFDDVYFADAFFKRLFGLLIKPEINKNAGLLLKPCNQIHTYMMKYSIDAVFLSKDNKIIHIEHNLIPNKITKYHKNSHMVLEIKNGMAAAYDLKIGDKLTIKENYRG